MNDKVTFRPMVNDDEIATAAKLMSSSEPFTTLIFTLEKCEKSLRANPANTYYVAYEGIFAGLMILQTEGAFRGYIQTICVVPELRSKGIGTAMIKYAEEKIKSISPNVFMCVTSFNERAQKLYYSLGYEKVGVLKDYIIKGADEYLLRKASSPWTEFKP